MSRTNYSLYCVPAAWVLSILPHFYAASVAGRGGKFDNTNPNTNPRNAAKNLESKLTKSDFGRYQRAEAAQQNGFENIALFATAVLVANQAKLPIDTVNTASFFYLASRVVYNLLYINTDSDAFANVRTVVFLSGIGSIFTLFIKAGNVVNNSIF